MRDDALALVWKALSHPGRRQILDLLRERPRTTGELCAAFEFSRFAVMKHLNVLEEAELVVVKRQGRQRWNYLNAVPIRQIYERWVSEYEDEWAASLLHLKQIAEAQTGEDASMAEKTVTAPTLREIHIEQVVMIQAPPTRVFDALTREISYWWKAPYFHGPEARRLVLEARLGGRLYEDWGAEDGLLLATVTSMKRPDELRLAGPLGIPGPVTGVIAFELRAEGNGTRLSLSHRAIGDVDEQTVANYSAGWEALLGEHLRRYVEDAIS